MNTVMSDPGLFTLLLLGKAFGAMVDKFSMLGYLLQYVRYAVAGIVSIFLAPLVFTKIGLAKTKPIGVDCKQILMWFRRSFFF